MDEQSQRPPKKIKMLSEDSSSDEGVLLAPDETQSGDHGFKVNEDFARRFEHNKRREELQTCMSIPSLLVPSLD